MSDGRQSDSCTEVRAEPEAVPNPPAQQHGGHWATALQGITACSARLMGAGRQDEGSEENRLSWGWQTDRRMGWNTSLGCGHECRCWTVCRAVPLPQSWWCIHQGGFATCFFTDYLMRWELRLFGYLLTDIMGQIFLVLILIPNIHELILTMQHQHNCDYFRLFCYAVILLY